MPAAKPIIITVATTNRELTKAAAASSSVECAPTIMVSAKLTTMIPAWVTSTGRPRLTSSLYSILYFDQMFIPATFCTILSF